MLDLEYVIKNSGDSIVESYAYSEGILRIRIEMSQVDKKVSIGIRTDCMSFKNIYLDKTEDLYRTCRIEIQYLLNVLSVENNIYIPSKTFGKLMNETKSNYHLSYGKKTIDVKYIFSLIGYDKLVSCLVSNLDCITIEELY